MDGMTCPRCAELERERDAANAGIGRIACERDAARAENRALDEAVAWIRVVGEECDARGDRTVILAKLRADRAENRALREALKAARYELSVAASYADDPEATVGLRVHGKACAKALAAVDACIVYTRAPSERSE